ncbi:hypothetical protein C8J57DRAFT_1222574 [Mycena rebaudengoi]|nr:hypothetical protein C8J57DRAFT_1222574 [Mycena rebaudengoi]
MAKNNMPTDSRDPWRLSLTLSPPEKSVGALRNLVDIRLSTRDRIEFVCFQYLRRITDIGQLSFIWGGFAAGTKNHLDQRHDARRMRAPAAPILLGPDPHGQAFSGRLSRHPLSVGKIRFKNRLEPELDRTERGIQSCRAGGNELIRLRKVRFGFIAAEILNTAMIYGDNIGLGTWEMGDVSIFGGAVDAEVEDHENNSATFNNLALEVAFALGDGWNDVSRRAVQNVKNFSFARAYTAGHEVPAFQLEAALAIFEQIIAGVPLHSV